MPKISIIVPVFNTENYLPRCIDSILAQTFTDFELLLINDGSKDKSAAICDEYAQKDSRIRVFHKENGGVSSARNLGLDNARGEWISFCDSDDYVETFWLDTFIKNTNGVDLVVQGFKESLSNKVTSSFYFEGSVANLMEILFKKQLVGYTYLKLFKSKIIDQHYLRFDTRIKFREDEEFVLKYFCHINNVRHIDKGGYNYYIPNWNEKYSNLDSYIVTSSMYTSVTKIYNNVSNSIVKAYLREYTFSLFLSLKEDSLNTHYKIKIFKELVGKNILFLKEVSILSRLILYFLPTFIVVYIYRLKRKLYL